MTTLVFKVERDGETLGVEFDALACDTPQEWGVILADVMNHICRGRAQMDENLDPAVEMIAMFRAMVKEMVLCQQDPNRGSPEGGLVT